MVVPTPQGCCEDWVEWFRELSEELLLLLLLLLVNGPFSATEGAGGTGSGLSAQSKPAGAEGEAASHSEAVPVCACLSLCPWKATPNPAVPACAGVTLAHRVLAALQHNLPGPGEAAPL